MKMFFLIAIVASIVTSCQESVTDNQGNIELNSLKSSSSNSDEREIPFSAVFYTKAADDQFAEFCETPASPTNFWGKDHQIGEGNATHLGKFTTDMTFCFHVVLDESGNIDLENGFGEVVNGAGYFEAANGDRLYFSIPESKVVPSDQPGFMEFDAIYSIDDGTGRFKGVSGELRAIGLAGGGKTDHVWEGTLILPNAVKAKS